jgi:hypothetical protein
VTGTINKWTQVVMRGWAVPGAGRHPRAPSVRAPCRSNGTEEREKEKKRREEEKVQLAETVDCESTRVTTTRPAPEGAPVGVTDTTLYYQNGINEHQIGVIALES